MTESQKVNFRIAAIIMGALAFGAVIFLSSKSRPHSAAPSMDKQIKDLAFTAVDWGWRCNQRGLSRDLCQQGLAETLSAVDDQLKPQK